MMNRIFALIFALALFCFSAGAAFAGTCSSPAGNEGEVLYNADYHTFQYCNGTGWMAMGGASSGTTGGIQSGVSASQTLGGACTILGTLVKDASGKLLVCDDTPSTIKDGTCSTFAPGAITFDDKGAQYVCTE